ncbi:hypothetical protein GGC64_000946 [Mycobacterium sp. OAS707]|uniref:hypothetical protein n=1 Tax=unclassified Mycobacterium TaxID=2642494 RepID=UPI00178C07BA|nr:hypothetical protein [Mycobacterium sp. OAS707]
MATLSRQCWLFAVGSTLFAIATLPGVSAVAGAGLVNLLCFVGSWFFTTAGWMQLVLSGPALRIGWLSAAAQFAGTILFNISTGASLWAHAVKPERRLVWAPDFVGSLAFLVSGALGVVAVTAVVGIFELKSRDWQAEWINMIGCLAFGVSALAAFVTKSGVTEDALLANVGTFVGALCFLVAALLILPRQSSA